MEKNGKDIDFTQLNEWCSKQVWHIFLQPLWTAAKKYLGLSKMIPGMLSIPENECDQFMTQILGGHEVGNEKQSSLVYSGTYRRANLLACFKEGHTQMKCPFSETWQNCAHMAGVVGIYFLSLCKEYIQGKKHDASADHQRFQDGQPTGRKSASI